MPRWSHSRSCSLLEAASSEPECILERVPKAVCPLKDAQSALLLSLHAIPLAVVRRDTSVNSPEGLLSTTSLYGEAPAC